MALQKQSLFFLASFMCCNSICFAEDSVLTDLASRVKALENEDKQLQHTHQDQRADIQMLQNVVHQQNMKSLYQSRLINEYMKKVNVLEMKLAVLQKVEPESKKEIIQDRDQTEGSLTQTGEHNSKHEMKSVPVVDTEAVEPRKENIRQTRAADNPVAFQATIRGEGPTHIGLNQIILFPDVIINLGSGYHNHLGVFIAPTSGVYIISTTAASLDSVVELNIMVNGNRMATAQAEGYTARNGQGTVIVVSQLAANDEVWVSLNYPADSSLRGYYYSNFMGCLVYP